MAYVEAESLQQAAGERRLSPRDAAALTKDIADAISFAHQRGVIHRDLKPANILVGRDGRPRVTDFGLARRIRDDSALTAAGQILGTPSFMPPEQAAGKLDQVGPLSDLYSLGAVLYFQLTGRPPFQSASAVDTLFEVLEADLTPPRDLNRLVHPDLEAVCLKCLAKDPGDRYKSVADFAEDLQRYLAGEPVRARRYSALSRCVRWARRRPALAATWLALPVFYLNHLANVYILHLPGTGGTYHCVVTAIVLVWAVAAWCFQRLLLRPGWKTPAAYCWACTEVALFTCFLLVGDGPRSALVVGYPLLIAAAALRAGPRLVCTVAGLCVSGYVLVLADAVWNRRQLAAPPPVFVPFLLCLVFVAVIQCLLLRRTPLSSDSALRGPDAGAAASPRGQGPA
jgi:serine/threonine-protein kinase